MEERIYVEAGVPYASADKLENVPAGMKNFRYTWHHKETGRKGTHAVQCYSERDMRTLIDYWNRLIEKWEYSLPVA